ncbi:MAG: aromatic amino acid ammonia-lyase [Bacteroidia bacterium]|nr:aromatic amino acid ammonia-lyase [Bacteroidia bacterium]
MNIFSTEKINLEALSFLIREPFNIPDIPEQTFHQIKKGHEFLLDFIKKNPNKPIYGINTGFGSLCQVAIPNDELEALQYNLIRSHACGCGNALDDELVRLMLALKIRALGFGYSGVHPETVRRLHLLLKNQWLPVVYEYGSLGASGDLAPLAHLSLPLIGEGMVKVNNEFIPAAGLYQKQNLKPIRLHPKEGLALLNGTQFMLAHLVWSCLTGRQLYRAANTIALLSALAYDIKSEPFIPSLHAIRPHKGQMEVARFFHEFFESCQESKKPKPQVQDPYSFRCIPQVHGASKDALDYAISVCETEINSVTDNPTLIPEENIVVSGGNFHGQPLALALDFLGLAMHELGNISERRIYLLLSGQRGLKPFLAQNAGLESGYMIVQYAAASMVSYNKTLCFPSSADSIISSNGQEDHVSMGANAGLKTKKIIENVFRILGMELLTAIRALKQKNISGLPAEINKFYNEFLNAVTIEMHDHASNQNIEKAKIFIQNYPF